MAFTSLNQAFTALDQQDHWKTQRQYRELTASWRRLVGDAVAAQTRPVKIQRRVLHVATSSAAWAQNLSFERLRLLEKLNSQMGLDLTDIRFSTALWHQDSSLGNTETATTRLWREHPSFVSDAAPRHVSTPPADAATAFQAWADTVQSRSRHLPLCPQCRCPAPMGELERWVVCSVCAAKRWSATSP